MKSLNNKVTTVQVHDELTRQFEYVNSLIERHRFNAITKVNIEVLLTSWEVGEYISIQLKTSRYASLMNKDNIVEYTLSRSLSPTMVAEYRRKLIPIDVMRKSLEEYCEFLNKR